MSTAFFGAAAIVALVFGGTYYFERRANQMVAAQRCRDEFFRTSGKLLASNELSEPIRDFIRFMADSIDRSSIVRAIVWALITGRLRSTAKTTGGGNLAPAVEDLRPELKGLLAVAAMSYLFALTFNNAILGTLIRRTVFLFLKSAPEPATCVVADVWKHSTSYRAHA